MIMNEKFLEIQPQTTPNKLEFSKIKCQIQEAKNKLSLLLDTKKQTEKDLINNSEKQKMTASLFSETKSKNNFNEFSNYQKNEILLKRTTSPNVFADLGGKHDQTQQIKVTKLQQNFLIKFPFYAKKNEKYFITNEKSKVIQKLLDIQLLESTCNLNKVQIPSTSSLSSQSSSTIQQDKKQKSAKSQTKKNLAKQQPIQSKFKTQSAQQGKNSICIQPLMQFFKKDSQHSDYEIFKQVGIIQNFLKKTVNHDFSQLFYQQFISDEAFNGLLKQKKFQQITLFLMKYLVGLQEYISDQRQQQIKIIEQLQAQHQQQQQFIAQNSYSQINFSGTPCNNINNFTQPQTQQKKQFVESISSCQNDNNFSLNKVKQKKFGSSTSSPFKENNADINYPQISNEVYESYLENYKLAQCTILQKQQFININTIQEKQQINDELNSRKLQRDFTLRSQSQQQPEKQQKQSFNLGFDKEQLHQSIQFENYGEYQLTKEVDGQQENKIKSNIQQPQVDHKKDINKCVKFSQSCQIEGQNSNAECNKQRENMREADDFYQDQQEVNRKLEFDYSKKDGYYQVENLSKKQENLFFQKQKEPNAMNSQPILNNNNNIPNKSKISQNIVSEQFKGNELYNRFNQQTKINKDFKLLALEEKDSLDESQEIIRQVQSIKLQNNIKTMKTDETSEQDLQLLKLSDNQQSEYIYCQDYQKKDYISKESTNKINRTSINQHRENQIMTKNQNLYQQQNINKELEKDSQSKEDIPRIKRSQSDFHKKSLKNNKN